MEQISVFSFKDQRSRHQGGQAVVEYILMLVVTVSFIIAAKGAFSNLNDFLNRYIADYTICLMDYGELPTLGVQDANQKKHSGSGVCDQKFEGFTLANGRPPVSGGGGRSNSASGGSNSKSTDKKGGGSDGGSSNSNSASGSSKSDADKSAGLGRNGKGSSPYGRGEITRGEGFGKGDGAGAFNDKKSRVIATDEEGGNGSSSESKKSSRRLLQMQNVKYRAITGAAIEELEKKERKPVRVPTSSYLPVMGDTSNRFGPYKKAFIPPEPKKVEVKDDDNSGFHFSSLFRMLIIIAMIVAIVVFFGSQIMGYNNSKD